ncbi:bifunctional tetrahydrofolate synthase/dihydrofolate synthase [Thioalkalivibrio thiocyanodenitrificans]|uniref:bifunctional tetrahydrofolate synthase/dihydrofolate synthase n=1 Tax=Thioalkalivibrio thiocyanodenitrificans TaxID=243063 RepID=UPI0003619DEA|nr:bifunctional tetrahydrofolate synthase/dihydrofolate synthase [Thioalkalivibrio thiocyanodenitrificans]
MRFQTLDEWLAWQETLHSVPIDLGLERVARVAQPLDLLHPACPVVTVAGTNGKGSTVAMLDAIYRAAGYRTGTFTSPHLLRYNERVCVDGVPASDAQLCEAFARVDAARGDDTLSYFEFGTLAALWLFREAGVEVMILEVGLGGRLDAVNIVDPDVAIVTSVGLDHQQWLGDDRERIGAEKAGIFRPGRAAVCGDLAPPASVIGTALRLGACLYLAGRDYTWAPGTSGKDWRWHAPDNRCREDLPLPALPGAIQLNNAATALTAVHLLQARLGVSREAVSRGLRDVRLPGRFQQVGAHPTVILDVAHNPLGAEVLAGTLAQHRVPGDTLAVLAVMADKDLDGVVRALAPRIARWYGAGLPGNARALPAAELCRRLRGLGASGVSCHDSVAEAFHTACADAGPGDRVLVFGSFYTVGEVLGLMAEPRADVPAV